MNRAHSGNLLILRLFATLAMARAGIDAQTADRGAVEPAPGLSAPAVATNAFAPLRTDQRTTLGEQTADSTEVPPPTASAADTQSAQVETQPQSERQAKEERTVQKDKPSGEKKGEWLFAPIPINSPAIGAGLEWAVGRVFPLTNQSEASPASMVGIGGVFTNNGSRAVAAGGRLYLKDDKYRFATGFGSADVNLDIYGVGRLAANRGVFVPLNVNGKGFISEVLLRVRKYVYVGARGQYRNLRLSLNQDRLDSSDVTSQPPGQVADVIQEIGEQLLRQRTVSIGPRFEWDSRDNVFYPKRGIFMDFWLDAFAQGLGSKWSYQYYKVAFNKYMQLSEHQVIAFRGTGCAAAGSRVPIYDLCLFGAMNDLRGYTAGRYQDRRMFATQAEYRLMFPVQGFLGRFGVVGFAGFGGVDKKFSDIAFSDLLPAGGGGIRFRLTKNNPINFRVDYGIGKVGNTLNIGVFEAF